MKRDDRKKTLINIAVIILLTTLVLNTLLRGEDLNDLISIIRSVDKNYIGLGILFTFFYVLGEAMVHRTLLSIFNYRIRIRNGIFYSLVGFFFSGITPSSSGGQPMQVYYMKKDGIEISHSSIVILIELISFKAVALLFGLVSSFWMIRENILSHQMMRIFVYLGLVLNILMIGFLGFFIFRANMLESLRDLFFKILYSLKFIPMEKKDKIKDKVIGQVEEFKLCSLYIFKNKAKVAKVLVYTSLQLGSLFLVSYFVYRSFGLNFLPIKEIFIIQALIYTASYYVPLPGAVGVSESNFLSIFSLVYPREVLKSALILTRGLNFYLPLILGAIVILLEKIVRKK